MDFLATARLLMNMQKEVGHFHYRFDDGGLLTIELRVNPDVAEQFEQAYQLFAPAD